MIFTILTYSLRDDDTTESVFEFEAQVCADSVEEAMEQYKETYGALGPDEIAHVFPHSVGSFVYPEVKTSTIHRIVKL